MIIGHFKIHFWLNWLFVIAFAGALYPRYEPQTVLIATLAMSTLNFFALSLSWRNRDRIERLKSLSDYTAVLGMAAFIIMLFASNLINALIWLIAFVQLALNLTFKESRHYYFGLLVSFILLCTGAAEAKTGFYLFYIITYCIFASISLGYYFLDRHLQQNHGTHQHMRWPVMDRVKVIAALIFLSFIIYLLIPRFDAGGFGSKFGVSERYYSDKSWEDQADNKQSGKDQGKNTSNDGSSSGEDESNNNGESQYEYRGFSESFDIRGEQQQGGIPPNLIVAYMQAEHGAYLKVETFDKFDGIRWHKSLDVDTKTKLEFGKIVLQNNLQGNYTQSITIEENLGPYVPAAAVPVELVFPSTVIAQDAYEMIKIPRGLAAGTHYSVDSSLQFIGGRLFSGNHYQPRKQDIQLPKRFDERIRKLSDQITQNAQTQLEKASLLEKHLRENYAYSYESIFSSQSKTPVAKFLFEDKKGHCEYFASSMAIMLRSLGIPSRLVTGYSATVENPLTGFYEIRVLDGHAWVEAWVDGLGWAVFEATPFYSPAVPNEESTSFEKIQQYVEQMEKMQEESGATDEVSLENILISIWQSVSLFIIVVFGTIKLFLLQFWKILVAVTVLIGISFILWKKWQPTILKWLSYYKVSTYRPNDHVSAVLFYMKHIQIIMGIEGVQRYAGATIEQYAHKIQCGNDDEIKKLTDLINQTHYSTDDIRNIDPVFLKNIFMKLYK